MGGILNKCVLQWENEENNHNARNVHHFSQLGIIITSHFYLFSSAYFHKEKHIKSGQKKKKKIFSEQMFLVQTDKHKSVCYFSSAICWKAANMKYARKSMRPWKIQCRFSIFFFSRNSVAHNKNSLHDLRNAENASSLNRKFEFLEDFVAHDNLIFFKWIWRIRRKLHFLQFSNVIWKMP